MGRVTVHYSRLGLTILRLVGDGTNVTTVIRIGPLEKNKDVTCSSQGKNPYQALQRRTIAYTT